MALGWYRHCGIRWNYTKFIIHNGAWGKGILWLAKGWKWVAMQTGTITHLSAFITLPLHCITWLYGLLNWVKPRYGGIIAQKWLNLSILECCLRKNITQSITRFSILRYKEWRILGTITVDGEMHFIFQQTPSDDTTTWSCRYCLASQVSILPPWVASILCWKYSRWNFNCHNYEFPTWNDDFGASHSGQLGCLTECKWIILKWWALHV